MHITDHAILEFIDFLGRMLDRFRHEAVVAETSLAVRRVSATVVPTPATASDYADGDQVIFVALHADLRKPVERDRWAIGMSLLLRRVEGHWRIEAEIGWTSNEIGWDSVHAREADADSIEEVMAKAPPLVDWMALTFREELAKIPT